MLPIFIHRGVVDSESYEVVGDGIEFGRQTFGEQPPGWHTARVAYPENRAVEIYRVKRRPREGGRTYEQTLPELVQRTGIYEVSFGTGSIIQPPFIVADGKTEAGALSVELMLHVKSVADLAEFSMFYERVRDSDEALRNEEVFPGLPFTQNAPEALDVGRRLPLWEGMYLVAELEDRRGEGYPFMLQVHRLYGDSRASCRLFWVDEPPKLAVGNRLFRRMYQVLSSDAGIPFRNGEVKRQREVLVATVLTAT